MSMRKNHPKRKPGLLPWGLGCGWILISLTIHIVPESHIVLGFFRVTEEVEGVLTANFLLPISSCCRYSRTESGKRFRDSG